MLNSRLHLLTILLFFGILVAAPNLKSQNIKDATNWDLVTDKKDMQVFTHKNQETSIKDIRITMTMHAAVPVVKEVLEDVEKYSDWVYKCEDPERLQTVSSKEFYYYVRSDMPFPASDRDLIIHSFHRIDPATGIYSSHSLASPDFLPEQNGVVRVRLFESYWTVTPNQDGTVQIDYRVRTDPGGYIPTWIVNLGISVGPVKTMERFSEMVHQTTERVADREDE
ncbi:MAG: hypothetical protein KDC57_06265 [Saprospiraceae bacterium]|nr:hypothetical protein [Saprospiraceae bacterium]